jgi:membrane-bound lytic murein transglycosylase D
VSPRFGQIAGHPLQIILPLLLAVACSTTQHTDSSDTRPAMQPAPEAADTTETAPSAVQEWEAETRSIVEELVLEARQLAAVGETEVALAHIDAALCAVFDAPAGYQPSDAYLETVERLVTEAEALEESLEPVLTDEFVEELAELPDIEIQQESEAGKADEPEPLLPESDYPLELNSTVQRFLELMSEPSEYRNRIEIGLLRSGLYLPMIRDQLRQAGLPEDLAYLPLIESAFSVKAYSRARAHGMWQFISSTGRHYGLEIGSLIDERRDPVRSTQAAVEYLSDLYGSFSDWHLALAAYNSGAGNVRRAIRRSGSHDFWKLRRYLPRETRNYVPAFIASVIVAKRPAKYGLPTPQEEQWPFDEVQVPDAMDLEFLASRIDLSVETLRDLNPAVRRDLTPAKSTTTVWLPPGYGPAAEEVLASVPSSEWAPRLIHTVRSGDTLSGIASRYGSSASAIRQANGLRSSLIHPGQTLVVPRFGTTPAPRQPPTRMAENGEYMVQRDDTLWDIARSFSVTVDRLCAVNDISRRQPIQPGQRLTIPTERIASATVEPPSATVYRVRRGDTLYDIARRFNVSVRELQRANGLSGSRIYPGDVLQIPRSRKTG